MKLHEHQAKKILASHGILIPRGEVAFTPQEARAAAQRLGSPCIMKAQVHAGGRGKAGGIRLMNSPDEVEQTVASILGSYLVTSQTDSHGVLVNSVLIEEALNVDQELYLAITIDPNIQAPVVIASSSGGMDIEDVADRHPELIFKEIVNPIVGLQPYQGRRLAAKLGLQAAQVNSMAQQMICLYEVFMTRDCSLAEVNPLGVTKDGRLIAMDAKLNLEEDALFRHREMTALRDWTQDEPLEAEASSAGIAYVKLDGDVGCLVNGAGLAMATMDAVNLVGCQPANFLDVGGGADLNSVARAMAIILQDSRVRCVLVNVFGGIARCDDIARGIVQAVPSDRKSIPIIVRLMGTNLEEGKHIFQESGLNTFFVKELADATQVVRRLAAV